LLGPAVGSRAVRKVTAGALFSVFAFLGAWTIGRKVITTMSTEIVDAAAFTPEASVGVLFFTGLALLISNLYGVLASTSMTAVAAIVGLGLATGTLNTALMFTILSAWIVAPLIAVFRCVYRQIPVPTPRRQIRIWSPYEPVDRNRYPGEAPTAIGQR